MFRGVLSYPLRADGDRFPLDVVLVGGGLHLLAVFVPILPLIPVAGYLVRVLDNAAGTDRTAFRTEASPPTFGDLRGLFADGLAAFAIALTYLAVPAVVLLVTARGLSSASIAGGGAGIGATGPGVGAGGTAFGVGVGFLVGSTVTLLLALTFAYLLPAALVAYARSRDLRAAFDADRLRPLVTDGRYLVAVGVAATAVGLALVVARPLNRLALGFFVVFYAETVAAALCGHAVAGSVPATEAG